MKAARPILVAAAAAYWLPLPELTAPVHVKGSGRVPHRVYPKRHRMIARKAAYAALRRIGWSMHSAAAAVGTVHSGSPPGNRSRGVCEGEFTAESAIVEWIVARYRGEDLERPAAIARPWVIPLDVTRAAVERGADPTWFAPPGFRGYLPDASRPGRGARRIAARVIRETTGASLPETAFFIGCASHGTLTRGRLNRPQDAAEAAALAEAAREVAARRNGITRPAAAAMGGHG